MQSDDEAEQHCDDHVNAPDDQAEHHYIGSDEGESDAESGEENVVSISKSHSLPHDAEQDCSLDAPAIDHENGKNLRNNGIFPVVSRFLQQAPSQQPDVSEGIPTPDVGDSKADAESRDSMSHGWDGCVAGSSSDGVAPAEPLCDHAVDADDPPVAPAEVVAPANDAPAHIVEPPGAKRTKSGIPLSECVDCGRECMRFGKGETALCRVCRYRRDDRDLFGGYFG